MQIARQVSLLPYNTFGIDASAEELIILDSPSDLPVVFKETPNRFIIGGGSNILLQYPVYETVIVNRLKGIEVVEKDGNFVTVAVGSGENWHQFVNWALSKDFGGLENLSLIPGTVGAAPIQNIGAYGVEIKDVLTGVDFYHFRDHQNHYIPAADCQFGYRDSIFKGRLRQKGFISKVYFRLTIKAHVIHTEYAALCHYLNIKGWTRPTIDQVSEAVIDIRKSKLPDWRVLGNAGSFFKNPLISRTILADLKLEYPGIPSYPVDDQCVKIPAAWLIQEAGFKGRKWGRVGCFERQPLVIVNYGGATGKEILKLKDRIQESVYALFGIELVPEVTVL